MPVLLQRGGDGPVERRGPEPELVADLRAVDDERFLELVLHLDEFPHRGVDQAEGAQQPREAAEPAGGPPGAGHGPSRSD
jgi:hypothetical protein